MATLLEITHVTRDKLVNNNFSLTGNERYEALMAKVTDPRLASALETLWSNYCFATQSHHVVLRRKLPFAEAVLVKEYDKLRATDTGFLAGEVHINLMVEDGVLLEIFYTGSPHLPETARLSYSLNGNRYTEWEEVLATLKSVDYAQARFPKGYARYQKAQKLPVWLRPYLA